MALEQPPVRARSPARAAATSRCSSGSGRVVVLVRCAGTSSVGEHGTVAMRHVYTSARRSVPGECGTG